MSRIYSYAAGLMVAASLTVTSSVTAQSLDTPMTRLKPIGAPSVVDQYRPRAQPQTLVRETAYQAPSNVQFASGPATNYPVRQAVMMQQFDAPNLPGGGNMPLPSTATPAPPALSNTLPPGSFAPGSMAPVPLDSTVNSSSDFAPMAQPQLGTGFATIDNCNCITAPSSYIAASASPGCAPVGYQGPVGYQPASNTFVAPPSQVSGPAILPGGFARPRDGIPSGPLVTFGQQINPVQVGQGILGQPVAYVPGQPVRNWIRYFFP